MGREMLPQVARRRGHHLAAGASHPGSGTGFRYIVQVLEEDDLVTVSAPGSKYRGQVGRPEIEKIIVESADQLAPASRGP